MEVRVDDTCKFYKLFLSLLCNYNIRTIMAKTPKTTKKSKLTVGELRQLHIELNGSEGNQGLLREKLPLLIKYHLTKLAKVAADEYEISEKLRNDIVVKLGTKKEETDEIVIPKTILKEGSTKQNPVFITNPVWVEYIKEFTEVLDHQKDVEHEVFKLADFEKIETDMNFPVFMSLLSIE